VTRSYAALAFAFAASACAQSSTPPDTSRGMDGGGALDAGGGGGRDAGGGGRDSGPPPEDGGEGTRDAGELPDAGSCTAGDEIACLTACGSMGARRCAGGTFGSCEVPAEACTGMDDDCDGSVDEGLTRGCSTACGSGTESCSRGAWGGGTAPEPEVERCSGTDDDCDGMVDEGFGALVDTTSYTTLSGHHAPCDGSTERVGASCNAAISRHCATMDCTRTGFGPVENSGDSAHVTCVDADYRTTSYTALAGHHAPCNGSTARVGPDCSAAIHRWCGAAGLVSGFGPLENSGDTVHVGCVGSGRAEVRTTSYTALSGHHAPCDGTTERWGANCNAAIHRWCRSAGFLSGFGPVENTGDTAVVTCVRD